MVCERETKEPKKKKCVVTFFFFVSLGTVRCCPACSTDEEKQQRLYYFVLYNDMGEFGNTLTINHQQEDRSFGAAKIKSMNKGLRMSFLHACSRKGGRPPSLESEGPAPPFSRIYRIEWLGRRSCDIGTTAEIDKSYSINQTQGTGRRRRPIAPDAR